MKNHGFYDTLTSIVNESNDSEGIAIYVTLSAYVQAFQITIMAKEGNLFQPNMYLGKDFPPDFLLEYANLYSDALHPFIDEYENAETDDDMVKLEERYQSELVKILKEAKDTEKMALFVSLCAFLQALTIEEMKRRGTLYHPDNMLNSLIPDIEYLVKSAQEIGQKLAPFFHNSSLYPEQVIH